MTAGTARLGFSEGGFKESVEFEAPVPPQTGVLEVDFEQRLIPSRVLLWVASWVLVASAS